LLVPPTAIQSIPPLPPVSGLVYTETGRNGFDVTRAFLNLITPVGDSFRARLTLDAGRLPGNSGPLTPVLRYAYAEAATPLGAWRLGLAVTPWLYYEHGLWQNRLQGFMFTPRQGWEVPADFGTALAGRVGSLDYDLGLYNGEGFLKSERDGIPSPQGRLIWRLGPGWEVAGYAKWTATDHDMEILALARRAASFVGVAELVRKPGDVYGGSVYGWWTVLGDPTRGVDLLARQDWVPAGGTAHPRYIAGIAYRPTPGIKALLDVEQERGPVTPMLHTSYQF